MIAESSTIPTPRPPGAVSLIVLELSREEHGYENFVNCALDGDDCDEAKNGVRRVPEFQEPLEHFQY